MGVNVYKSGCNDLATCVDFFAASRTDFADGRYNAAINRNIGNKARSARAIDYSPAPNNQIMHADSPLFPAGAYQL
jgi:hypothetical protein